MITIALVLPRGKNHSKMGKVLNLYLLFVLILYLHLAACDFIAIFSMQPSSFPVFLVAANDVMVRKHAREWVM